MESPIQIAFHKVPHSDAVEAHIREKAAKLDEFHPRITSCRVTVEEQRMHHHQGHHFSVKIDVRVPGKKEIVVNRQHDEDIYVALRDAFAAVQRQLEDTVREKRGDVKTHAIPQHGKVARILAEEGYGFIETPDGRELYFSRENVVHPDFDDLGPGVDVQFIEEMAAEGPQAKRVSVGKHQM